MKELNQEERLYGFQSQTFLTDKLWILENLSDKLSYI